MIIRRLMIALAISLSTGISLYADGSRRDPAKIINDRDGASCSQCHKFEVQSWQASHHFGSLKSLTEDEGGKVKEIVTKLGFGNAVSNVTCAQCHFTTKTTAQSNEFTKTPTGPVMGVSCESCHGAAKEWHSLHSHQTLKDFLEFDPNKKAQTDIVISDDIKKLISSLQERLKGKTENDFEIAIAAETRQLGMIRPQDTYELINNCYGCHTVPNPELVNKTEHAAGSEFEIIAWLNGEIRHSFRGTNWDEPSNREFTQEKKRELFVAGRILYVEHALRAIAMAAFPKGDEEPTRYFEEMQFRVADGIGNMLALDEALEGQVKELKDLAALLAELDDDIESLTKDQVPKLVSALEKANRAFIKAAESYDLTVLDEEIVDIEPVGDALFGK
mgnify:CR=1 FL=1